MPGGDKSGEDSPSGNSEWRQIQSEAKQKGDGDSMSSLSNQPSGSPFSDYTELCTSTSVPPQNWDWQRPAAMDVGTPRGLMVGGRAGLTDEDKLCFFEQPGRGRVDLQVPGKTAGISGSVSLGSGSLGSAGDSPDSPLSSSPSPSPASPGRMPSALACGATARVPLPPVPGSPVRQLEAPAAPSPARGFDAPPSPWSSSSLAESSPKVAMPQVAPNYCVIGDLEGGNKFGTGAAEELLGAPEFSQGSSRDDSEEEEEEEEEELEPCFMGRAEQQRKAMRRAMSECSHLSVPTSLELPDTYPGGMPAGVEAGVSPTGGLRRSPNFIKRSLTVSDDQPPTPPPTLSAAGATQTDLRLTPPEPRLRFPPFPPLKDGPSPSPGSPMESPPQGFTVEKELGGIVLPVPTSPKAFASSGGSDDDEDEDLNEDSRVDEHGLDFASSSRPTVAGVAFSGVRGYDGNFTTSSYSSLGSLNHNTNPFITLDGRWLPGRVL